MTDTGGYIRDAKELQVMQSYPLWMKVMLTKQRIREWVYQFGEDGVVVSFSGGKDSTVLLHLVREEFPNVKAVFSNTGLEYTEIQRFVKSFDNVDIVTPTMNFGQVITTYGYPIIGKEVAEAIYYARRIRSQSCNVERERERLQSSTVAGNSWENGQPYRDERSEKQKNNPARSVGREVDWKRLEIGGAEEPLPADNVQENRDQRRKKSRGKQSWADWRRGCL